MIRRRSKQGIHAEHPDEHFTMPADHIDPPPANKQTVRLVVGVLAIAVTLFSVAVVLVAFSLLGVIHSNSHKSQIRDQQHSQTESQIGALASRIQRSEANTNAAICTLVIAAITQADKEHQPIGLPVQVFAQRIGCKIPTALLPMGTPTPAPSPPTTSN